MTELEKKCPTCNGNGYVDVSYLSGKYIKEEPCPECEGKGTIPTPEGEKILEFMRKSL